MKLSIRLKLLIGFTILLLITSIVQGLVYLLTNNYVSSQINHTQQTEVNHGASAIKYFVAKLTTHSRALAQKYKKDPASFATSASYLLTTDNYIRKITVLSQQGREIEEIDLSGPVSVDKLSYEISSEPLVKSAAGVTAFSKVYYRHKELAPHVDIYTPITPVNASSAGIIKMRVNLHQVRKELSDIRVGENGFLYVVDDEGRLISHASDNYVLERPNLSTRKVIANALLNKQSTLEEEKYINENNVEVVAKAVKIPDLNWVVVFEQPRSEAYSFLTTLLNLFVITFTGSTLLLLILAFYLSENLTSPIRKLQRSAQEIESGKSKKTVIINSGDEIESLSKSFASMTDLLMQRDQWLERTTMQLKDLNEKLKELDKRKDDFVSVASHELRTPMTAVKSYLSMALDGIGGPLTEKQRYYIDRAYVSSDRLIAMVNDMLNISRIESGRLTMNVKNVMLDALVQEVIDDVKPRAGELEIAIEMKAENPLPAVIADREKIKEVLFNLIGNSMKFTSKGGKITVSLYQTDQKVQVTIQDTGTGIEPADMPKLFEKFGLLPGSYSQGVAGTGLGLYICKSIIELHEGEIYAKSPGRNKGTQVIFTLKVYTQSDYERLSAKFKHDSNETVDLIHNLG